jgi:hypothetical protein
MAQVVSYPWWLKPANKVLMSFLRLGVPIGTQRILTIPGRKTGKLYSTPVALLTVEGARYICTLGESSWVKNARASKVGTLRRGRTEERIVLTELPVEERAPILREFPRQVRGGVQFFERMLGIPNNPEAIAAAAPQCPVFRITPHDDNKRITE